MDVHSPEQRSFNMSRIKGKDTSPEMMIRRWLWSNGYRYRLHRKNLAGRPDLVLSRYGAAIFVHGCFWHRHGCLATTTPASRQEFWRAKFQENVKRDERNVKDLMSNGWRVMIIWECGLRGKNADLDLVGKQTLDFLRSDTRFAESPDRAFQSSSEIQCTFRKSRPEIRSDNKHPEVFRRAQDRLTTNEGI